ncbi:hypothetical protein SCALM49S_03204 [Streptomyces californicus]
MATTTERVPGTAEPVAQEPLPVLPRTPDTAAPRPSGPPSRTLAGDLWDRHGAAVARALARMPALRGKEQEAARADLIALRMYLHLAEGPLSHGALTWSLRDSPSWTCCRTGACVASALNRMPSYRGVVLRGTAILAGADRPARRVPGRCCATGPCCSTVRPDAGAAPPPGDSYVIWSVAGRRVRQFSEQRGPEEVVFAPGTLFRVLAVRRARPGVQIHLRELTGPAEAVAPDPEGDRTVLARLEAVAPGPDATPKSAGPWPDRCTGAVGGRAGRDREPRQERGPYVAREHDPTPRIPTRSGTSSGEGGTGNSRGSGRPVGVGPPRGDHAGSAGGPRQRTGAGRRYDRTRRRSRPGGRHPGGDSGVREPRRHERRCRRVHERHHGPGRRQHRSARRGAPGRGGGRHQTLRLLGGGSRFRTVVGVVVGIRPDR